MNLFRNYKFYLIIAYILILIVYNICYRCGIIVNESLLLEIMSYVISMLIAYNVITINNKKTKEDVEEDLKKLSNTINNNKKLKHKSKSNKKDVSFNDKNAI